jgi:uncharacterized protein (TIGR03382 family)
VRQQPEQLPARAISCVGAGIIVAVAMLVGVAWALVRRTPAYIVLPPSTLERSVFDPREPDALGSARLDHTPAIEAAIDAVVDDPSLIGGHR